MRNKRNIWSLIVLWALCFSSVSVFGQQEITNSGTDFWFAYPEFYDLTSAQYIVYVSASQTTSGNVSIPGSGFSKDFTCIPGKVSKIYLPAATATITKNEKALNLGIHVVSKDDISVYASTVHQHRSEASLILPVQSLGSEYRVMSYPSQSKNSGIRRSEFTIVSIQDKTEIEITPSCVTALMKPAGQPFTITLDKGELYMVQSAYLGEDVTGSVVRTTNPDQSVAVFGGHEWAQVYCGRDADPLFEQLYPVNTWGKTYTLLPTPTAGRDVARILSVEEDTRVSFNGKSPITLKVGKVHQITFTEPTVVEADKPISVGVFSITGNNCSNSRQGDPSMTMVNPNEQMLLDNITFFTVDDYNIAESYIQVITRTDDADLVRLNGDQLKGFTPLASTPEYAFKTIKVPAGSYNLTTDGCGFLAYAIGLGDAESYAYSAGVSLSDLSCGIQVEQLQTYCENLEFKRVYQLRGCRKKKNIDYTWNFSDGTSQTGYEITKTFTDTTTYWVEMQAQSPCGSDTSRVKLPAVLALQTKDISPDTVMCNNPEGMYLDVSHPDFSAFRWDNSHNKPVRQIYDTGTYTVLLYHNSGCRILDSIVVGPTPLPNVHLAETYTVCPRRPVEISLPEEYYYLWSDAEQGNERTITKLGQLWVRASDGRGCFIRDTTEIIPPKQLDEIFIPNAISPNGDDLNDVFRIPTDGYGVEQFNIYNRWGELVYQSQNNHILWDASNAEAGVYIWICRMNTPCDASYRKGTLTVIR